MSDDQDWEFKVSNEELKEHDVKKKKVDSASALKRKSKRSDQKLKIDESKVVKRESRSAMARRIAAMENYKEFAPPEFPKRLISNVIDVVLLVALYALSAFIYPELYNKYMAFLSEKGMNQSLEPQTLEYAIRGVASLVMAILLVVFPVLFTKKTLGKNLMQIRIGHAEEDRGVSGMTCVLREFIFKPLSVATVIGFALIFFNEKKRGLHDFLLGTSLYIDD